MASGTDHRGFPASSRLVVLGSWAGRVTGVAVLGERSSPEERVILAGTLAELNVPVNRALVSTKATVNTEVALHPVLTTEDVHLNPVLHTDSSSFTL